MRTYLGGKGLPREEFALAGIGESTGAPVILLLNDGEVFTPADYISLGYDHFEAWCVGASGGRGGDASGMVEWRTMKTTEVMPEDIWLDVLSQAWSVNGPWYEYVGNSPLGTPRPPEGVKEWIELGGVIQWILYPQGLMELQNPSHTATITHYLEPLMIYPFLGQQFLVGHTYRALGADAYGVYTGGGGGGGGLHVVAGRLDELPSTVTAEVGVQGASGAHGQSIQSGALDPSPTWTLAQYPQEYPHHTISQDRWNFLNRFPNGHPTIGPPAEGSPGGVSSFGDICKASGGKGGKPAIQWAGSTRQLYGYGGQGGIGDTDVPGGGADGATLTSGPGRDGGWDGAIGKGGGGGHGGAATEGGRGSLNYGDTSVYGARGPLGTYTRSVYNYDPNTGDLIAVIEALLPAITNPGSGGGARIPGNRKYGSRATGYSHDGAVLVRLSKLD